MFEVLMQWRRRTLGALAAWGVAEGDSASVWQAVSSIYFQVAPHGEFVLRRGDVPGWH